MTRRSVLCATGVAAFGVWLPAQGSQTPPPQTFRTSADVVMVDVTVRRGNTPVTGLTAADFDLRDNGVRQDVETVESRAVPIDLSIVVDVSGDSYRPWTKHRPVTTVAAEVDEQVRRLTRLLRDGDRVRLFAVDTELQQVWPLQSAPAAPPVRALAFDGQSSLYNTLATVLLQPVEPTRRHVIVAATKGLDTTSVVSAAGLRAIAEQSDAQLHLVMQETRADAEYEVHRTQCSGPPGGAPPGGAAEMPGQAKQGLGMGLCWPTYRFWVPARRQLFRVCGLAPGCLHTLTPDGVQLKAGAEATGGGLYQGAALSEPTLHGVFADAFENFRQSYVLRYTARGVTREGWHRISVTVPRDRSLRIQARTGYAIDAPPPPAPPSPPPVTNTTVLRTLADLTTAYEQGAYDPVTLNLRRTPDPSLLIRDFDRAGNPWPGAPRREAVFALELVEAGVFSPRPTAREDAVLLLDRFAHLIRHPIEPTDFERAWWLAALTMLQGTIRPSAVQPFVQRALARFPGEPRFRLAQAIVADQRWPRAGAIGSSAQPGVIATTAEHAALVASLYEAAAAFPEVRDEASIRLAWFEHRTGRSAEALARADGVSGIDARDPQLAYLRELLRGHALTTLGRPGDAVAAFRRAVALVPGAQSGRVALMNSLLMRGERVEADAIAEALQATPTTVIDPWWTYWQGDYRRYPQALRAAREMAR